MTVIELHDAYIMQDVNTVLHKVTFALEKGEFAYLVGRTGSGKSSLLKTLYADLPLPAGTGSVVGFGLPRDAGGNDKVPYLRRKLGRASVRTVRGLGYQLGPGRTR